MMTKKSIASHTVLRHTVWRHLGPAVQSIFSLTMSLSFLVHLKSSLLLFFAEKMRESSMLLFFAFNKMREASQIFSAKNDGILGYF